MVYEDGSQDTRRSFLLKAACLSSASIAPRHFAAQEPFDSLPASVWRNARRNGLIMIHRPTPSHLSSRTQIAANDEPGDRLIVAGQVFAPDGLSPAPGVTVYAYNTDAQGYYGENKKEYPPRIYGWIETNAAGRFELRTIRPGFYPGMQVPAHIHFELWGGDYPLQWTEQLEFKGDRYLTPDALAKDALRGDFNTIQRLNRAEHDVFHCSLKIRLQRETTFLWGTVMVPEERF